MNELYIIYLIIVTFHFLRPFDNVRISWYRINSTGRAEIPESSKYIRSRDMRVLTISMVDINDAGIYECEGSLNAQTTYSPITQRVTLTVLGIYKMYFCAFISVVSVL